MSTWIMLAVVLPFLAGIGLIPLWIYLKLPLPRQLTGRIMFIFGQVCAGGSAVIDDDGELSLRPFNKSRMAYHDGTEWVDIEHAETVYRTGWRPFAIVPEIDADRMQPYTVDDSGVLGHTDGGVAILDQESGGYQLASEYVDRDTDGVVVDAVRYVREIGRTGNRLLNQAEEYALRKYGGDSQLSDIWRISLIGGGFFVMFVTTWFMLGF